MSHPYHQRSDPLVFVTGGTGYIGGRLVPRLLSQGYRVRCLARSARKLASRSWSDDDRVEIVEGDLGSLVTLSEQMRGCCAAFYLIHSMETVGKVYRRLDRTLAAGFAQAAELAGVDRIVYLGGLGETGTELSEHLTSRREVEAALASTAVPVTTLRAAMILGSGSASFEILRYLVERLPVMVTPRWVSTECQPIAVDNVLHYLVTCLETPETEGRTLDIGGPDILTYHGLMRIMAEVRGLPRRLVLPVPVLTPRLSAAWIHLVTPISHRIARPLAEGLRNRVVCRNADAARLMPQPLLSVRESIQAALDSTAVPTSWIDAGAIPGDPDWSGGSVFVDRRAIEISAGDQAVFQAVLRIGGGHGYYTADWLWRIRGWLDRLAGGPGLRRGRRHPDTVAYGDVLDFWRVTGVEPGRRLVLRAEMRLPGEATLEFAIEPGTEQAPVRLVQTARFKPRGLLGLAYWWMVLPLHQVVFEGMLRGIGQQALVIEGSRGEAQERPGEGSTRGDRVAPSEYGSVLE